MRTGRGSVLVVIVIKSGMGRRGATACRLPDSLLAVSLVGGRTVMMQRCGRAATPINQRAR